MSVNHRLGLFGFLRLDDPGERFADSGAVGVLDMIAALRWVRDNIAGFGGDAGNVTLFGQSGGGAKVCALMATEAALGLFHKAIAQSCSGALRHASIDEGAAMARHLAGQIGLTGLIGEALQSVPLDRLLAAFRAAPRPYRPVLDGRTIERHAFDRDAPPAAAGIPFMVGNTAHETRLKLRGNPAIRDLEEAEVLRRVAQFLRIADAPARRIVDTYREDKPDAAPIDLLAAITTDYTYIRNTRRVGSLQSASDTAPVYTYVFDWHTPVRGGTLGAPHTVELPFIFGTTRAARGLVGDGPDHDKLTRVMIATWTSFARTGDPNNPAIPHWPRHDQAAQATMILDAESRLERNPGEAARAALNDLPYFEYSMLQD